MAASPELVASAQIVFEQSSDPLLWLSVHLPSNSRRIDWRPSSVVFQVGLGKLRSFGLHGVQGEG